ncbi:MAG: transposase [Gammaproteobacteria bacterium]|nr:transposase [Gammaproteobacteria bacterium]
MEPTHRQITYRLLPVTRTKAKQLERLASTCRFVWNHFLAKQLNDYQFDRCFADTYGFKPTSVNQPANFFWLGKAFTALRQRTPWLQDHSFSIVRYTLKYQAIAWRHFFNDTTGTVGMPKFKSRYAASDGFTIPEQVKIADEQLYVPKIGWCKLRRRGGDPFPEGVPKQARVIQRHGKWYAVVAYAIEREVPSDDGGVIGVDMNVGQVATSEGELLHQARLDRLKHRKRRYQRMRARRQKGSNRRARAKRKLNKTCAKIANQRRRWAHVTSRHIADQAHTVAVEALPVKHMSKSAKGTVDRPGKRVKQKAGLNRSIQETGWGQLRAMLAYKAGRLVTVDPKYTSQRCHVCGHVDKRSRKTQAIFKCVQCGHESNADINAAMNIKASATGATGRARVEPLGYPTIRQNEPVTPLG